MVETSGSRSVARSFSQHGFSEWPAGTCRSSSEEYSSEWGFTRYVPLRYALRSYEVRAMRDDAVRDGNVYAARNVEIKMDKRTKNSHRVWELHRDVSNIDIVMKRSGCTHLL